MVSVFFTKKCTIVNSNENEGGIRLERSHDRVAVVEGITLNIRMK